MKSRGLRSSKAEDVALRAARSALTIRHLREVKERRETTALRFRQQLLADLGAGPSAGSAAREALVNTAVSAFVEISETTLSFLNGRGSSKSMERVGNARSELRRCLRTLGLSNDRGEDSEDPSGPPPNATAEQKREWSRRYVERPLEKVAAP